MASQVGFCSLSGVALKISKLNQMKLVVVVFSACVLLSILVTISMIVG